MLFWSLCPFPSLMYSIYYVRFSHWYFFIDQLFNRLYFDLIELSTTKDVDTIDTDIVL